MTIYCPCGGLATVTVRSAEAEVCVCSRCASLLEMLTKLAGVETKRRPLLGLA